MLKDYVPPKRALRQNWYGVLSDNVVAEGAKFNAGAGQATAVKAIVDGLIARMKATNTAQDAVDSLRTLETDAEKTGLAQLRAQFKNWKTLPGWAASGSEGVLELVGPSTTFDPNNYQTTLTAAVVPGGVKVSFPRKGAESMAIYQKVNAAAEWKKVGSCIHSPFIDHAPLAVAGVPEQRHYMARGLVNDAEIGQDSDAVSVTFAG